MKAAQNLRDRDLAPKLLETARKWPAISLTGPRQSGKTTLCRALFPKHPYISLEPMEQRDAAIADPRGFLSRFPEGGVIDEIQQAPDLLSYIQVDIDDNPTPGRWILAGSQNLLLLEAVSQSLAGRAAIRHLLPLARGEVERFGQPPETLDQTLYAGSYPRVFECGLDPADWFDSYIQSYVERDVQTIRKVEDLRAFHRFLRLCAGRTAQLLNYQSLANDCGISQPTAKAWISILEASFIIFLLPAFHANLRKRLVKMPKLHFYDTGLVCRLLGINSPEQLHAHPLRGPIFETWVASEILKRQTNQGRRYNLSFYRDSNGIEVDLVIGDAPEIMLLETRSAQTPSPSLLAAMRPVRRLLEKSRRSCSSVTVYGGDDSRQFSEGHLISWKELHRSFPVRISSEGRPVADAHTL